MQLLLGMENIQTTPRLLEGPRMVKVGEARSRALGFGVTFVFDS